MRRLFLLVVLVLSLQISAFATWSVVAVDRSTGRIVIASATCVNGADDFLKGVQAVVIPGKAIAACQAAAGNQAIVFQELQKGTEPKQIIELIAQQDPQFQSRQYGIVDLQGRSAGHSGLGNGFVSQDIQGQVPGTEIFYSIQGNILRSAGVVPNAVKAFVSTNGAITDRVMAAMEAADAAGGDSRCVCPADATASTVPCAARTAHVAYILMAEKADTMGDGPSNGKYAMYITVSQPDPASLPADQTTHGPNQIKTSENLNPVKTLRVRYDVWRKAQPASFK
jgi:uncharacterized Ntn-hydrolase superfamily protein